MTTDIRSKEALDKPTSICIGFEENFPRWKDLGETGKILDEIKAVKEKMKAEKPKVKDSTKGMINKHRFFMALGAVLFLIGLPLFRTVGNDPVSLIFFTWLYAYVFIRIFSPVPLFTWSEYLKRKRDLRRLNRHNKKFGSQLHILYEKVISMPLPEQFQDQNIKKTYQDLFYTNYDYINQKIDEIIDRELKFMSPVQPVSENRSINLVFGSWEDNLKYRKNIFTKCNSFIYDSVKEVHKAIEENSKSSSQTKEDFIKSQLNPSTPSE